MIRILRKVKTIRLLESGSRIALVLFYGAQESWSNIARIVKRIATIGLKNRDKNHDNRGQESESGIGVR